MTETVLRSFVSIVWLGAATLLLACGSDDGSPAGTAAEVGGTSAPQGGTSNGTGNGGALGLGGGVNGASGGANLTSLGGSTYPTGGSTNVNGASSGGAVTRGGSNAGGAVSNGGASVAGSVASGGRAGGGGSAGAPDRGGQVNGGSASGGAPTGGTAGSTGASFPTKLTAIGANGTNGVDWPLVAGATGYRIYWSTTAGVSPQNGTRIEAADPGEVHAGVTNGTTYYYVVTAMVGGVESQPSPEASATPGGEWVLRFLGHGQFDDLATATPVAKIAIPARNHVLLFAEGYLASDLARFDTDVNNWMTGLFALDPYSRYKESFVVWSLPRASTTRIGGGDTAFRVPVTTSGTTYVMASSPFTGELATRMWAAITAHPIPPTEFGYGLGGMGTVVKATAAFLLLDPTRTTPQAGISGLTTTVTNPTASNQRIATAFGIGHEHEFTHAFARLVDEYMEEDLAGRTWPTDGQSNVVGTNACGALPWSHLLYSAGINDTDQLIGAFGRSHIGFHSELLCQMNGSHDNATYYGTANLRTSRFCHFCREMTAYRILSRAGLVSDFNEWTGGLRTSFYRRFGMNIPTTVPQRTSTGTTYFEPCASAYSTAQPVFAPPRTMTPAGPTRIGDVVLEPEDLVGLGWLPR